MFSMGTSFTPQSSEGPEAGLCANVPSAGLTFFSSKCPRDGAGRAVRFHEGPAASERNTAEMMK
jgi:hypothetical protein